MKQRIKSEVGKQGSREKTKQKTKKKKESKKRGLNKEPPGKSQVYQHSLGVPEGEERRGKELKACVKKKMA